MDFFIKKCDTGDSAALFEIESECFSVPWSESALFEALKDEKYIFLSAVSGGKTVGYIGAFCVLDEVYITNIGVLGDYRKQGIGEKLMREALNESRGRSAAFVTLEVRVGNSPAVALYEKLGFKLSGRRKDFYEKPKEDAYIYTYFFGD